ncbi:alpha/beta hydrolase family esterase [Aspergillus lucknowensis]|uniref:Feruloyl esterase C n=1 Tax=Aspergillus lucknowensis TaxID=176173 RepID=A0ABR4LM44_9EURO
MLCKNFLDIASLLLLAAPSAYAARSSGCGAGQGLSSGVQVLTINGVERQYTLTVPDDYDTNNPYRLIIGMHWWGGTMTDVATGQTVEEGVWAYYGQEQLAEGTAIFVAPQGIDNNWYNEGGSDFMLVDEMISTVESALCVDTDLRFAIGFSWGGAMSFALSCRETEYPLRAITSIAGAGPYECSPGTSSIGYLGIHGISDDPDRGRTMRDLYITNNGCTGEEQPAPSAGSLTHVKTEYQCSGPPVTWITFDGGHQPAPYDGGTGDNGSETFVSGEAWAFFSQFQSNSGNSTLGRRRAY